MDKARKCALEALNDLFKNSSYSNITLNNIFSGRDLSPKDKAFSTQLFYGVLDRKITLDYVISKYVKKELSKTPLLTLNAIRLALYQIMYCDKIPDSAAVNESVNLVKNSKEKYNAAFVNGVLRNVLRNGILLPQGDDVKSLSVKYSCPEFMINGFINDYGKDTAVSVLEESLKVPPVFIRVNTLKTTKEQLAKRLSEENINCFETDCRNALKIESAAGITNLTAFKEGLFHVEDLSCQKAIEKFAPSEASVVLDACASPGGKSFTMAQIMNNSGKIVSSDIYESRLALVSSGAERLGIKNIETRLFDATKQREEKFDFVLCDVPCSGFGVLRRKPEIKYKPQSDYSDLSKTQLSILKSGAASLKDGGRIMYSTCTLRHAENEDVVSAFLKENRDFETVYEHTFFPLADSGDGFYFAILQKSR